MERVTVVRGAYHDSAFLMRLSRDLAAAPGVAEAVVVMATPMNRQLLVDAGFAADAFASAGPLDLVIALRGAAPGVIDEALAEAQRQLSGAAAPGTVSAAPGVERLDWRTALAAHPEAHLVSIAVPGPYAAFVAGRALDAGRHVFLFSDNVPLADEVRLKRRAVAAGLLLMGPDCGTAVWHGVGLGFANRVRSGPVGLVGASGTGMQEVMALLDAQDVGVSHAIGTGSRDLSAAVGGCMSEFALRLLAADADTRVIVLVAKHPDPAVAEALHAVARDLGKPVVVRYLGSAAAPARDGVRYAASLDEAARWAAALAHGADIGPAVAAPAAAAAAATGRLVGLFGGGSLAAEAQCVLERAGLAVAAPTAPLRPGQPLGGTAHLLVDTGDDVYTVGRPHPMIDQALRAALVVSVGADPAVSVLLLDLVLGDGAHADPAPELVAAVVKARESRSGPLTVVCSLCGTRHDPQDRERQAQVLRAAGIVVTPSAAEAAHVAVQSLTQPHRSAP